MNTDFKKECAKELKKLVPQITGEDRQAAFDSKIISKATLTQYLKGNVVKIDLAMTLIRFFRKRIKDREKELMA